MFQVAFLADYITYIMPYYCIRPSNGHTVPVRPVSTYGYGVVTVTVRCHNSPVSIRVTVRCRSLGLEVANGFGRLGVNLKQIESRKEHYPISMGVGKHMRTELQTGRATIRYEL